MRTTGTVKFIQAARKAGLDMREVSERLDAAAGKPGGLRQWRRWVRDQILHCAEKVSGH